MMRVNSDYTPRFAAVIDAEHREGVRAGAALLVEAPVRGGGR